MVCVLALLVGSGLATWAALRGTWATRWVLGTALVLRLIAFPMAPALSDDASRYLWDGGLTVLGISPYAHRPDAPELADVRQDGAMAERFERMNSPGYYTVYPPLSQAVFAIAAAVPGASSPWYVLKGWLTLVEGLGIWALSRVVPSGRLAWYALSPVAVIEIAGQGHSEGLLVGAIGVLWWAIVRGRSSLLGPAVVAAGWVKLYPFALGTLFVQRLRPGQWVGVAVLALALGAPLGVGDGLSHVLESVRLYSGTLDFYAAPYLGLKALVYPIRAESAGRLAAALLSSGWLAVVLWAWHRDRGAVVGARRLLIVVVAGYALQSPMVHPWNALGALALTPLMTIRAPIAWLVALSSLTYVRYVGMEGVYAAAIWIGWGGAAVLWGRALYRKRASTDSGEALAASIQA